MTVVLDLQPRHVFVATYTLPRVQVLGTRAGALVRTLALAASTVLVDSARRLVLVTNTAQPGVQLSPAGRPSLRRSC